MRHWKRVPVMISSDGQQLPRQLDGQAWMMFEANGALYVRHYDGSSWAPKEAKGTGSYANLKMGANGSKVGMDFHPMQRGTFPAGLRFFTDRCQRLTKRG